MQTVLAGDLGGTKCRVALVGADGSITGVQRFATLHERAPFLAALEQAIATTLTALPQAAPPPLAAGFGTAGVIPPDGQSIEHAPNLPLDAYPLAAHLASRFGLPVTLCNDGRASALGEYLRGAAAGSDPLLCLFFGTGIGIGLVVGGKAYAGAANAAGEIGHTIHLPQGRRCPCGGDGHFEAYCGGRAITERAAALPLPAPADGWTVGAVVAAARNADGELRLALQQILHEAEQAAAVLVANAVTLLNPAACVLGGGMLQGWPELPARIEAYVRQHTSAPVHRRLRFVDSQAGSDAILWGAAAATGALAMQPLRVEPGPKDS